MELNKSNNFDLAVRELEEGHFSKAMLLFKDSLEDCYAEAMYYIGYMYEFGLGTKDRMPNSEKAFHCYYESYNEGNESAANCFKRLYENLVPAQEEIFNSKYPDMKIHKLYSQQAGIQN